MTTNNKVLLTMAALAFLTFVAYYPALNGGFLLYDDHTIVSDNPVVRSGITAQGSVTVFTNSYAGNWYPLTWLSHMLTIELFGMNPRWHHLVNLVLHIVNTLLLLLVLHGMTGALWQSAFVAALFALHPLHVEAVAWISGRRDVLSSFFWLLTMGAYLAYVRKPRVGRYLLMTATFLLGLMSKPMLVSLPFVLLLLDLWPLTRFRALAPVRISDLCLMLPGRIAWLEKLPLLVAAALTGRIAWQAQQAGGAFNTDYPIWVRLANALVAYVSYIGKVIMPVRLAAYYPHPGEDVSLPFAAVSGLLLLAITALVLTRFRKRPYLTVGWLWYLGTLVPVIGLVQVGAQAMADRYTYITLTGLFIIASWGIAELTVEWRHRTRVLAAAAAISLALFASLTWTHARLWQSDLTLFSRALEVTENNFLAHMNLGIALKNSGRPREAESHFKEIITHRPDSSRAHFNLGFLYQGEGHLEAAEVHYREALKYSPNYGKAHFGLAVVLEMKGDLEDAAAHYLAATKSLSGPLPSGNQAEGKK